jgi:hypothetical protein
MKKLIGIALAAASLLLSSGAQAQTVGVRADVPFDFVMNNKIYPAGTYEIREVGSSNNTIMLQDGDRRPEAFALTHACSSLQPAEKTKLVFKLVGGEYFLAQAWTEGNTTGVELRTPKRETLLSRNGDVKDVIIAANIVK